MAFLDIISDVSLPLTVGQSFSRDVYFDAASVKLFATLVGDSNPLHHDNKIAERSRFGSLIASGTQTSSVLAAMVASKLSSLCPSLGLKISFSFRRPVHAGVKMIATWKIVAIEQSDRLRGEIVTFFGELFALDSSVLVSGTVISLVTPVVSEQHNNEALL
jgi:acyl dehydratase